MISLAIVETMSPRHTSFLTTDEQGRLIIPAELAARLHLEPGQPVTLTQDAAGLHIEPSVDHLGRVYLEPTNICNFDCSTCMRNAWDEALGSMSEEIFQRVLESLRVLSPVPLVFFGGFGEPLAHPKILEMVKRVKALGGPVELITNGSLLDEARAAGLIEAGLDRLWVSLDGATPQGYADVRLGDALPEVIENLERMRVLRARNVSGLPKLGIAFVAMRRNIHELPQVIRLGRRLGADRFSISNVLAHTPALRSEVLYSRSYYEAGGLVSEWSPLVQLPRMEINDATRAAMGEALEGRMHLQIAGQDLHLGGDTCPFVRKASTSIRWDGAVSPCLALLHSHTSYLDSTRRSVQAVSFGSLVENSLSEIWQSPRYRALRASLAAFDFSPCVFCNSCEFSESNQEDCFGNTTPTCGGCLWAQGLIQCP